VPLTAFEMMGSPPVGVVPVSAPSQRHPGHVLDLLDLERDLLQLPNVLGLLLLAVEAREELRHRASIRPTVF
jgi:hypothetical protein